jgi:hypothetical protein
MPQRVKRARRLVSSLRGEGAMALKIGVIGLCAAVIAVAAVSSADAQTPKKKRAVATTATTTRVATAPRARVRVAPRSFLDAGTEVLPGDRKFTDYAFPVGPYSTPQSVVTNIGGRVGWHYSPLPGPFDLPSRNNPFGW